MKYRLIIKEQATQDLWQLANYILVNGNAQTTFKFLNKVWIQRNMTEAAAA